MARPAPALLLALAASACNNREAPSGSTPSVATLSPHHDARPAAPNATAPANVDARAMPPAGNAMSTTTPSLSAPGPACAAMAQGQCHASTQAACAAIACPSEMCVASGERPAVVRCQR